MKKVIIAVLVIVIVVCGVIFGIKLKNKPEESNVSNDNYVTNYDYLYERAIDYLREEYTKEDPDKDMQDFQIFFDYEDFGIVEEDGAKYAYMWILAEAYYVENGEVKSGSGSSMAYKIKFVNEEVDSYEIPKDGSEYTDSIKEMFPENLVETMLSFELDDTNIKGQVAEHYSYL